MMDEQELEIIQMLREERIAREKEWWDNYESPDVYGEEEEWD